MLSKGVFKTFATKMSSQNKILVFGTRRFGELVNWETDQPPKKGSWADGNYYAPMMMYLEHLDTKLANSKYYDPHLFDPQRLDYQEDIRLAARDELPDELDAADIAESMYAGLVMTELTWPSLFFGIWAAFEPDVLSLNVVLIVIAHHSLPLGKGTSELDVQR